MLLGAGVAFAFAMAISGARGVLGAPTEAQPRSIEIQTDGSFYAEDFENPMSGWPALTEADFMAEYLNGEYHLNLTPQGAWWVRSGPQLGDFDAQVDVRMDDVTPDKDFGLNFRMLDIENFYSLIANPLTGTFALVRRDPNGWTALVDPAQTPALTPGNLNVTLRVSARGSRINAWINGTHVASVEDFALPNGKLGFLIENNSDPDGVSVFFDNLMVGPAPQANPGSIFLPNALKGADIAGLPPVGPAPDPQGIHGRVTHGDGAAVGVPLSLQQYATGQQATIVAEGQTGADGTYSFANAPALPAGQMYFVRFGPNQSDPRMVSSWYGPDIVQYAAGASAHGGDFDLINIEMFAPEPNAMLVPPVRFAWFMRPRVEDTYQIVLFEVDGQGQWATGDLGRVSEANVNFPAEVPTNTPLGAVIRVLNGEENWGFSYFYTPFQILPPRADRALALPGLDLAPARGGMDLKWTRSDVPRAVLSGLEAAPEAVAPSR
jgi:hypothetical protein